LSIERAEPFLRAGEPVLNVGKVPERRRIGDEHVGGQTMGNVLVSGQLSRGGHRLPSRNWLSAVDRGTQIEIFLRIEVNLLKSSLVHVLLSLLTTVP